MDEKHTYLRDAEVDKEYWRLVRTAIIWEVQTVTLVKVPARKARSWKIRINKGRIIVSHFGSMKLYPDARAALQAKLDEHDARIRACKYEIETLNTANLAIMKLNK